MLVYHMRFTVLTLRQEIQLTLHFCALCMVFFTAFKEEVPNYYFRKTKNPEKNIDFPDKNNTELST